MGHGDDIAELAEFCRHLLLDRLDQPRGQDRTRTLQEIADNPTSADLSRLDPHTDAALMAAARLDPRDLEPEQLRAAALLALATHKCTNGRTPTNDIALRLVRGVMTQRPALPVRELKALIGECLTACGFLAGNKNVEKLLKAARRV